LFQLFVLALIEGHSFLRLFLLLFHVSLVAVVHGSQFAVFLLKEVGLISVLDHGLHETHAEGEVLIADSVNVELELLLYAPQLHLQLTHQVAQLSRLHFPRPPLLDLGLDFRLIVSSQPAVLLGQPLSLRCQHFNLVLINSHHFPQVSLVLLSSLYLQTLVFP
jgi:hypothetical protein